MNQDTYIPFADIVLELEKLCDAGKTGVLSVVTPKNKSAQIMLSKGTIVFVYFFNKRGKDALSLMMEMEAGRFRFQEGAITAKPMNLPPTQEIVQYLLSGAKPSEVINVRPAPPPEVVAGPAASAALTLEQRDKLEYALSKYIGPMATIICEDSLDGVADLSAAIEALATEIPDSGKADQFRSDARQQLGL